MDRINGERTIDIGSGRRGFRKKDAAAGVKGTELAPLWFNGVQEELMKVIEAAGLTGDPDDWTQLLQAIRVLAPNLGAGATFYVNGATGNDANQGTNTAPFATIQGAINFVSKYICYGTVTINVAAGTYGGFQINPSAIENWKIVGSGAGSCTINASATGRVGAYVVGSNLTISGFTIQSYYDSILAFRGSYVALYDIVFIGAAHGAAISSIGHSYIDVLSPGVSTASSITFAGSFISCLDAHADSYINVGFANVNSTNTTLLTFSAVTVSSAVASVSSGGIIVFNTSLITFSGTPTGQRYYAQFGAIITFGSGVNYLPGTVAGTTANGGQYI